MDIPYLLSTNLEINHIRKDFEKKNTKNNLILQNVIASKIFPTRARDSER